MASDSLSPQRVLVVGVGLDGPASLPAGVRARVAQAQLLVGGQQLLDMFADVSAERVTISGALESALDQIERAALSQRVVVLEHGDPCFLGIGPVLAGRLGRERVEIVPGVSSVALAFARLGVSWEDARVISAHGTPLGLAIQSGVGAGKLAVLTDGTNTPSVVAAALLRAGAVDAPAWVFEQLNGPAESEFETTLGGLADQTFAALNVLVVPSLTWSQPADTSRALFGLHESLYAQPGSSSGKPEVRAIILSKLQLRPGGVLWDVGAGSGSLAIEATGLVPRLTAHAIERSEIQLKHLWRNVGARTSDNRVRVVIGDAPDVFPDLPDPDAVFVGGSGGRLSAILTAACARLRPNGRIVCNLVTIENQAEALRWAESHGVTSEIVQVSLARGTDIIGSTRLQAENPVTVMTFRT